MYELSFDADASWIRAVRVMCKGGIVTMGKFFEIQFQSYIETFDKKTKLPRQCS
jgi:hypothetical protein